MGALRAKAKADGVDVSTRSTAGSRPVDDDTRPVTSGDMMQMFAAHTEKEAENV